jgi:hypothetical protein
MVESARPHGGRAARRRPCVGQPPCRQRRCPHSMARTSTPVAVDLNGAGVPIATPRGWRLLVPVGCVGHKPVVGQTQEVEHVCEKQPR